MGNLSFQEAASILFQETGKTIFLGSGEVIENEFYGMYEAKWFIEKLYGDKPRGQLILIAEDDALMFIDASQYIAIARLIAEKSMMHDLYFCIGLVSDHFLERDYVGPKGISAVPSLWINVKIKDPLKNEKWLPSEAEAVKFLKTRSMKPQIIVNAVSELQAYWIFNEPFIVDSAATRDKILEISNQFQNALIAEAQCHGWEIENTSIITNRQRLPGTWNRKINPPVPIRILEVQNL